MLTGGAFAVVGIIAHTVLRRFSIAHRSTSPFNGLPDGAMQWAMSTVFARPEPLLRLGAKPYPGYYRSTIETLALSPDGAFAVTGTGDPRRLRVWDLRSGRESLPPPRELDEHLSDVLTVAFSPDGRRLASAGPDRTVRLWDPHTRELLQVWSEYPSAVSSVAFSADGSRVVSGHWDGVVCVWDARALEGTPMPVAPVRQYQRRIKWAPNIPPPPDKLPTKHLLRTLHGHESRVSGVSFAPDRNVVVSGGWDGAVIVWDVDAARPKLKLMGHTDRVFTVAVSSDGKWVVSGGDDGTIRTWSSATGQPVLVLVGHQGAVRIVCVSSDGQWIVSGGDDCSVRIWDASTGALLRVLLGHTKHVRAVAVGNDRRIIASGGSDRQLLIWDCDPYKDLTPALPPPLEALPQPHPDLSPSGPGAPPGGPTVTYGDPRPPSDPMGPLTTSLADLTTTALL